MKIDFHVHANGPHMIPMDFFRFRAAQLQSRRPSGRSIDDLARRIHENSIDPGGSLLLADLAAAGIDHAVVVGTDWARLSTDPEPETSPEHHLATFEALRDRAPELLSIVIGIDPRRDGIVAFARDALGRPGVRGVKFYPPMGFSAADPLLDPLYRAIADAGRFAMFHTGKASYPFDLQYGRLEQYSAVQRRHPDLTIVLAHAGHGLWGTEALEVAVGHPRTFVEVSGWNHSVADGSAQQFLARAFDRLGSSRVLFATDHLSGPHATDGGKGIAGWREIFETVARERGEDPEASDRAAAELLGLTWRA